MTNAEIVRMGEENFMHTYASYPIAFKSGKGCYLYDEDGNEYLDMVAGIAVNALGYGNNRLTEALISQLETGLIHTSNLYYNEKAVTAASKLNALAGSSEVFFCNSGAEANEAAIKLARKYGSSSGRSKIISMNHSFHGRTYGAITLTGQDKYHVGFSPLLPSVAYAEFNNIESVKAAASEDCIAIIVEPIQGEGGVIKAEKRFLEELRAFCDERDILLIFDEVQCGMGRTGYAFAYQNYGVTPDILTLAKALGGGVPMGACVGFSRVKGVFTPGNHASTFGGNYLAAAAANVMLDILAEGDLLLHVQKVGAYLEEKIKELCKKFPSICLESRGLGLMRGIVLSIKPAEVVQACLYKGLLVASAGYDVLRFVPPLVIRKEEIDKAMDILSSVLQEFVDRR